MKKPMKFWNWKTVKNDTSEIRTLFLNGAIAEESWYDDDVTPKLFRDELMAGQGDIVVWINSPGGDCVAASQIYNMLMDYKGNVTVKIDGIAASAASVIAMAGTKVCMSPTALLMIHNPFTVAIGDSEEMKKAIAMLDEVKESIINAYELKTGLSRAKISHMMDAETWISANKAVELGFADEVLFKNPANKVVEEEEKEKEDDEKEDVETETKEEEDDDDEKEKSASFAFSPRKANISLITKVSKNNPVVTGIPADQLFKRLNLIK